MPGFKPNTTEDKQNKKLLQQPPPSKSPSVTITMKTAQARPTHFTGSQFLNVAWQILGDTSQGYVTLVGVNNHYPAFLGACVTFINTHSPCMEASIYRAGNPGLASKHSLLTKPRES